MTTATHEWLRRLSDYHSGGVSDAERAAIEAHLRTCLQCQEALAMYRRFYALLQSPLRLGAPNAAFSEDTPTMSTPTQVSPNGESPYGQPRPRSRPRRKLMAGIAAGLAAAIVVAGFLAVLATRGSGPSIAATPVPHHTATSAPQPTDTVSATPGTTATTPPALSAFVCANPAGSQMVYAYVRGDGNLYVVHGCSAPQRVDVGAPYPQPLAWSPSNSYLMVATPLPNGEDQVVSVNFVSGGYHPTGFSLSYNSNLVPGDTAHIFIGWLSDKAFLGVNVPITSKSASGVPIGPMTLVAVDLFSGTQRAITKITWAANFAVRNDGTAVFYGGYQSASEGGAYLHRVDLASGVDTKLVLLGKAEPGGCQVTPICPWTAPWDVTADGTHVLYHNPAPNGARTDIYNPPDTPLFYANSDGSGATKPFGSKLAASSTTPVFSPDGRYVVAAGSNYTSDPFGSPQTGLAQVGGGYQIVDGYFEAWRADSQAMVLGASNGLILYTVSDGTTRPLEANSSFYVWGNS